MNKKVTIRFDGARGAGSTIVSKTIALLLHRIGLSGITLQDPTNFSPARDNIYLDLSEEDFRILSRQQDSFYKTKPE